MDAFNSRMKKNGSVKLKKKKQYKFPNLSKRKKNKNEQSPRNLSGYNKGSSIHVIKFQKKRKKARLKKYSKKQCLKISQVWQKT